MSDTFFKNDERRVESRFFPASRHNSRYATATKNAVVNGGSNIGLRFPPTNFYHSLILPPKKLSSTTFWDTSLEIQKIIKEQVQTFVCVNDQLKNVWDTLSVEDKLSQIIITEIGSGYGCLTLALAMMGFNKVQSIESDPEVFKALIKNLALYGQTNIMAVNMDILKFVNLQGKHHHMMFLDPDWGEVYGQKDILDPDDITFAKMSLSVLCCSLLDILHMRMLFVKLPKKGRFDFDKFTTYLTGKTNRFKCTFKVEIKHLGHVSVAVIHNFNKKD